jgi:hypothetical protein
MRFFYFLAIFPVLFTSCYDKCSAKTRMTKFPTIALIAFCSFLSGGCRKADSVASEINKWEALGWEFHETVGTRLENAVYLSHESSTTPRSFTAISTTDHGALLVKDYKMVKGGMLVVTMGREAQGCFSLVFTRFPEEPDKSTNESPSAKIPPFSDVIITDIYESKGSRLTSENSKIAFRCLFLDFMASNNFESLTAYGRDRLVRILGDEVNIRRVVHDQVSEQFVNLKSINRANSVFYGDDDKEIFCVIGGSEYILRDYEGEDAKAKLLDIIKIFEKHIINLHNSLQNDAERNDDWGSKSTQVQE